MSRIDAGIGSGSIKGGTKLGHLRVLHVNFGGGAGISHYGLCLADGLANSSRLVTTSAVAGLDWQSQAISRMAEAVHIRINTGSQYARLLSVGTVVRAARLCRPNLIHDSSGSASSIGVAAWPLLSRIAPLVITEHDPIPHYGMGGSAFKRLARAVAVECASAFVVHGPWGAAAMLQRGAQAERIHVVPHGHYGFLNWTPEREVKRECQRILFFGALRPNKGVEDLPSIVKSVRARYPDARFTVAGSANVSKDLMQSRWPEKLEYILRDLRDLGVELDIRFVPDDEVANLFRRAGVALLPYRDGSQSGVAAIAMALGAVVVATDVGDIGTFVEDGVTGALCKPSASAIADGIMRVVGCGARRDELAGRAQRRALDCLGWQAIAERTELVYEQVLAGWR